jgi:1-acyl-sn-glycerol-3-phosphate acyltransferase
MLGILAAIFIASLFKLEYKEDVAEFFPDNADNERINAFYRHIGSSNKILVFFSMRDSAQTDKDRITEAVDSFANRIQQGDSLRMISNVKTRSDDSQMLSVAEFIRSNAPYFLSDKDYSRIDSLLQSDPDFVGKQMREAKQMLMLPSGAILRDMIAGDPLMIFAPTLAGLQGFQAGDGNELYKGYHFMNNGRKGVAYLSTPFGASESKQNTALIKMVESRVEEVRQAFPDMRITYFGTPAIAVTNASQIKQDSLISSALAALLIFALLWYCFRNMRNIALTFLPVAFGWLFAMAALSAIMSSVSVIVIGISSIVMGIALNYPLHYIDRLRHEQNPQQALIDVAPPLIIGNITTVGAFISLVFINSSAMRNLGLFASLLLIGTIIFVLLFLPHLVKVGGRGEKGVEQVRALSRIAAFAPESKPWIVWSVLGLTLLFFWFSRYTSFEADANKISYLSASQEEDMQDTYASIEREGRDIVYMIAQADALDDALRISEANQTLLDSLHQAGLITDISGIGPFLPSQAEQARRIDRWNSFWETRREGLLHEIHKAAIAEGFRPESFNNFRQLLLNNFAPQTAEAFAPITELLEGNYLLEDNGRKMVVALLYCLKDQTAPLLAQLNGAAAGSFAFDSRNVLQRMVDSLSGDFNYVLYVSGFIVFLFLMLSFGRIELSLLAFLPLTISWVWILGIMQIGGLSFNIVNIILATFIFGQGDDYTIFITEGLIHEYAYRRKMLASYKNSIILSALIMFAGMGMLIFAKHPALRSLAEVTVVGMFSVVLMAYLIPPLIFRALTQKKGKYREAPVTLRRLAVSAIASVGFLLLTGWITLWGMIWLGKRRKSEQNRLRYHRLLWRISSYAVRHIPGVSFNFENLSGEKFETPGIVISNHQSHLDLICLLAMTPKLVVITNQRVWHNPFYGLLIRYADFYPASEGVENMLDKLSERIANGYSVLLFPEGTRSKDCSIMRFHQGAFFLAEKLNLEIIPAIIHGAGHVLPKQDMLLKPHGRISMQLCPRIKAQGRSPSEYTKQTRRYYRDAYAALAMRMERAAYFAPFVAYHYIYKGIETEYAVRRELKKHKAYSEQIDQWRPTGGGQLLAVNGGFGAFAIIFALVHRNASIISVDTDPQKIAIASNCEALPPNVRFCLEADLSAKDVASIETVFLFNPSEEQRQTWSASPSISISR